VKNHWRIRESMVINKTETRSRIIYIYMHYNIITCTTHHQCPEKKIKKILLTVRFEPALAKDLRKKKKKKVATVGFEPAPASFFCPN
jgi:hypothetical protein